MSRINLPPSPGNGVVVSLPNDSLRVFQDGAYRMVKHAVTGPGVQLKFDRYDLAITPTNGVLDVEVAQTFKLDNSTSGVKTISIVNAPPGRSMAIILQIVGKAGTIVFPETIDFGDEVPDFTNDNTSFTIYWNGETFSANQSR